jgi:hypothetical protein
MVLIILVFQAVSFAILSGIVASNKKRDPFGWGVIGFLFGIFGFLAAIVVGDGESRARRSRVGGTARSSRQESARKEFDADEHEKKCPACAEYIKLEARVCKHCGHEFSDEKIKEKIKKRKMSKRRKLSKKRKPQGVRGVRGGGRGIEVEAGITVQGGDPDAADHLE